MKEWIMRWLRGLYAAFQFLTTIPLPRCGAYGEEHLRRSVVFYPVVGLAIGGALAAAGSLLQQWFPAVVSGALLVVLWVGLTGGLHLDGFMDTADGLLSGQPRERMLEIMRDSRSGAMGVIACTLLMIVKTSLLVAWMDFPMGGIHAALLMLVPLWSRSFMTVAMAGWNYARQEGLGGSYRGVGSRHAVAAFAMALVLSIAVIWAASGMWGSALGYSAALMFATGVCGSFAAARIARRLGGLTGDTYGALNEGLEVALMCGLVGWLTSVS